MTTAKVARKGEQEIIEVEAPNLRGGDVLINTIPGYECAVEYNKHGLLTFIERGADTIEYTSIFGENLSIRKSGRPEFAPFLFASQTYHRNAPKEGRDYILLNRKLNRRLQDTKELREAQQGDKQ